MIVARNSSLLAGSERAAAEADVDQFGTVIAVWGPALRVERVELWAFADTGMPALKQRRGRVVGSGADGTFQGQLQRLTPSIKRRVEIRTFLRAHYARDGQGGGKKRRIKTVPA